jgi:cell division protein FtsI (penicillin-binding protein 3)
MSVGLTKWARLRIILVGLGLACCGLVLFGRFIHLQIINGAELREELDREVKKHCPVMPVRGLILDRRGVELAISTEVYSLVAHPRQIKNADLISGELAPVLGLPALDLKKILTRARPFVFVRRHLTPEREEAFRVWKDRTASRARATRKQGERPDEDAIYLIPEARRYYPQQCLAGPILGFCDIDGNGLEGLEHVFNQELYGQPKNIVNMLDARGHIVVSGEKAWDPEVMGNNLVLTIDRTIQYIAEKELQKGVGKWKAASGLVMVTIPQTGEILAMAQVPRLDPNLPSHYPNEARQNRALTDALEPGSAFKVFIVAAALDSGVVKSTDPFHCENGVWRLGAKEVIHDVHPYGGLTVQQIIQKSSNIGTAKISHKLGPRRLDQYLRDFGFGKKTGLPFPGETAGLVKNHQRVRSLIDRTTTAFGQGVSVSVLQLTMALGALGNGGVLMEPILVREIISPKGDTVKEFKPRPVRRVVSEHTAATMLSIMETVTQQGGTATGASPRASPRPAKPAPPKRWWAGLTPAANTTRCSWALFRPTSRCWPSPLLLRSPREPFTAVWWRRPFSGRSPARPSECWIIIPSPSRATRFWPKITPPRPRRSLLRPRKWCRCKPPFSVPRTCRGQLSPRRPPDP